MKIRLRDVLCLSGRDYLVVGLVSVELSGQTSTVARAVDGDDVLWVESPPSLGPDADGDRLLVLRAIDDLDLSAPPPESISYHGLPYLLRRAGRAMLTVSGEVPERAAGDTRIWRYHTAGDRHLQIEEEGGRLLMLAGEAVHRGMIDLLPGS
jgi:Domain of unknown function (DUF4178)